MSFRNEDATVVDVGSLGGPGGNTSVKARRGVEFDGVPIFIGLTFLTMALMWGYGARKAVWLLASGQTTQGVVVSRSQGWDSKKRPTYFLGYTFKVGEKSHSGLMKVDGSEYAGFSKGQLVSVTYLPDQPSRNSAGGELAGSVLLALLGVGICGPLGLAAFWSSVSTDKSRNKTSKPILG